MSAQEHWTRCGQGRPDVDAETDVLIFGPEIDVTIGAWDDEENNWFTPAGVVIASAVTHWRHMPAPPLVKP